MTKSFKRLLSSVLAFIMTFTCLTVANVSSVLAATLDGTIGTYSADTATWDFTTNMPTSSNVSITDADVFNGIVCIASGKSNFNTNKYLKVNDGTIFAVPVTEGQNKITLTTSNSNSSRKLSLAQNGTAIGTAQAIASTGLEFSFTSSNLTVIDGKNYIEFIGSGGEAKLTKIQLTGDSVDTTTTTTETTTTTTTETTTETTTTTTTTETTTETTTTETTTEATASMVEYIAKDGEVSWCNLGTGAADLYMDSIAVGDTAGTTYTKTTDKVAEITNGNSFTVTTTGKATIKIYGYASDSNDSTLTCSNNTTGTLTNRKSVGNTASCATFNVAEAGTYTFTVSKKTHVLAIELLQSGSSEETTTETTSETTSETTTEASAEESTVAVSVNVGNPGSSSTSTISATAYNGTTKIGTVKLNIGSATDLTSDVNAVKGDTVKLVFSSSDAKKITNWVSFDKYPFKDKSYTLSFTADGTTVPSFDYYDEMGVVDTLGQTTAVAADYGTYGYGEYKTSFSHYDLADYAVIKGYQYSMTDVASGDYDKDGTAHGLPDERILLNAKGGSITFTNNISDARVLVLLDVSGKDADIAVTNGSIYESATSETALTSISGMNTKDSTGKETKFTFYITGGSTITITGTSTTANDYTVVKSIRLFSINNVTDSSTLAFVDNGTVADITESNPIYSIVQSAGLETTDKVFTLIGTVKGDHNDADFLSKIENVGYTLLPKAKVDVTDSAGNYNPKTLIFNDNNITADDAIYIETTDIYKGVFDSSAYDPSKDTTDDYTGDLITTASDSEAYFAYLVAVKSGESYYAYPFTLYAGDTDKSYDATGSSRITLANE